MKTYLLLRNNKQTGLYTETCLKQMNLQKFDLIWVEGESITWKYPSEIVEFQEFSPKAELSLATLVHNRKEKQIIYFDTHIEKMGYKNINVQEIQEPDAALCDIAPGFEFLVKAQNYRKSAHEVVDEEVINEIAGQKAVDAVYVILNEAYTAINSIKSIDIMDGIADYQSYTTTIMVKKKKWKEIEENHSTYRKKMFGSGFAAVMTALLSIISTGYIYLK